IRLNTEATKDSIAALDADAILVATGARYSRTGASKHQLPGVPGANLAHVLTPEDILLDHARLGDRILIYDNTSYEVGPGIAEYLADKGKDVTFVTIDSAMAMSVTELGLNKVIARRVRPKVTFFPSTAIAGIDPADVRLRDIHTGAKTLLTAINNIVLVTSKPPEEGLYHALISGGIDARIIGDAREARWSVFATDEAIKDGRRAGLAV
ncbi:MAG: hypothetical protein JWR77_975, partial [Rhizorhabdus sp.]|nr:hypothetical protein [Rhizorhabdus sp.]